MAYVITIEIAVKFVKPSKYLLGSTRTSRAALDPQRKMSERSENLTFFSKLPRPISCQGNLATEKITTPKIRQKLVSYEVTSYNLHRAIRDIQFPFDCLRHFDETKKSKIKFLAPLKLFGYKNSSEARETIFNSNECPDVTRYKSKILDLHSHMLRKKEKGQSFCNIPEKIAENFKGMTCETYFSLSRNISNLLWLLIESDRRYHEMKNKRTLRQSENSPTIYNFQPLSEIFETIFYSAYKKLGFPDFTQLNGYQFLNFLKWRSVCYTGPFLTKIENHEKVAIYVMGQFSGLKLFNCGEPLHGLYLFDNLDFKNSHKFENLPPWFMNTPKIAKNGIDKTFFDSDNCQLETFI